MKFFKKLSSRTKGSISKHGNPNESAFASSSVQINNSCRNEKEVVDIVPLLPDSKSDNDTSFNSCEQSKINENMNKKKILQLRNFVRNTRGAEKQKKKSQKELNGIIIPTMTQSSDASSCLILRSEEFYHDESKSSITPFRQGSFSDNSVQASGSTFNSTDSSTHVDSEEFIGAVQSDNTVQPQYNFGYDSLSLKDMNDSTAFEIENLFQQENCIEFKQVDERNESRERSNSKNIKSLEQDAFHVLNELLVLENEMVSQQNKEEEDNVEKIIEGVISRRLQREFIVCDKSCGEISDIQPSFSDNDSIWTSISQCTTRTAKISNRKQGDLDNNNSTKMKSTPGNEIKVSSKTSQQPQIQHVHEYQSQDDAKNRKKVSRLAEDMRTIFEDILQTKYLNMKPSSAALLLKENLEYAIKVAGFAKNDNQRFISAARVSE